jgi:hypothetical protein
LRAATLATLISTVILVSFYPGIARAQADPRACNFDRCALRLQYRFFSTKLVRGTEAHPIARLGWFPPRVLALEGSSDSAKVHYRSFQSLQKRGGWLTIAGLATSIGAMLFFRHDSEESGPRLAFFFGGIGLSFASGIHHLLAQNQLSQSVWWYNRELSRTP